MKTIEFKTAKGSAVSFVPSQLAAFLADSHTGRTNIFIVGDSEPFEVMGSYDEVMEKIKRC